MSALEDIAAERAKQIAKGYTASHDDEHDRSELALAAASFVLRATRATRDGGDTEIFSGLGLAPLQARANCGWVGAGSLFWPWKEEFPYSDNRRTRLVKAAALIIAEIERLDRAATSS